MRRLIVVTDGNGVQVDTCELSLLEVKTALDLLLGLLVNGKFPAEGAKLDLEDRVLQHAAVAVVRGYAATAEGGTAREFLKSHGFELTEVEAAHEEF